MCFRPAPALLVSLLLIAGVAVHGQGCGSLAVVEAPVRSTPAQPLWNETAVEEHLRFFNSSEVAGRATGTAGYATAASYVAARLAEFELQPALGGRAQVVYATPLNTIRTATLTATDADTLVFYPGVDFLPDGRSDQGDITIRSLTLDAAGTVRVVPGATVLLPRSQASTVYLETLRDAGAAGVLLLGALEPQPMPRPVGGMMIVQVLPETAARLLGISRTQLAAQMNNAEPVVWSLPRAARLRVETQTLPTAGAINVLGYVPGKHPVRADELVIVCADLDAVGTFAGVPTLDAAHLGVGVATLLEVAQQYAVFAQFGSVPQRTLLFAVFSGARQGHAGLRDYLRHPPWPLRDTHAMIYLGLDPPDEPTVRSLLLPHEVPLYVVPTPPDTLSARGVVLMPTRRPPRRRTIRPPGEVPFRVDPPKLSDLIDAGVVNARRMAEATHSLLLREAVGGASLLPVNADTLRVPQAKEQ